MWDYTDKVKEYFFDPKNAGVIEDANAVGEVGAISCGDALKLMMKVDPDTQIITDAKFQTFGCGSAIASSSALTEIIIGKTIAEAAKITNQDIADFLGGLPPEKMHCSVMGQEALMAAIANFKGEVWEDDHEEGELVCKCFGVDAGMIERAVRVNKLTTPEMVTFYTKAGGGCLTCFDAIEDVLGRVNAEMVEAGEITAEAAYKVGSVDPKSLKNKAKLGQQKKAEAKPMVSLDALVGASPAATGAAASQIVVVDAAPKPVAEGPKKLTTLQRIKIIEQAIEDMRPFLKADGGDCELVDVEGSTVFVKLSGACVGCQSASVTIGGVQERLMLALGQPIKVVPVK